MVEPSKGNTPGTLQPECVSTPWRRIATLVRPPLCEPADKRGRNTFFGRYPVRICQTRNRMREIRTSGSVRGEEGNLLAYSTRPHGPKWVRACRDASATAEAEREKQSQFSAPTG